jgi:hypothetical protein
VLNEVKKENERVIAENLGTLLTGAGLQNSKDKTLINFI